MGANSAAATAAGQGEGRQAADDEARTRGQRAEQDEPEHERAVEKVIVRAEALQEHEARRAPGPPRLARPQVQDQLGQGEGHEAVGDDVEARPLVDLVGVERVQRARRPGRHRRQSEHESQPPSSERGEEADEAHGHVGGQHGVPRRPEDGRHRHRRQQPMVGEGQAPARCGKRTFASNRRAGARKTWCTFQATRYTLSSESPT